MDTDVQLPSDHLCTWDTNSCCCEQHVPGLPANCSLLHVPALSCLEINHRMIARPHTAVAAWTIDYIVGQGKDEHMTRKPCLVYAGRHPTYKLRFPHPKIVERMCCVPQLHAGLTAAAAATTA
mmetsp:Transcript_32891/g.72639  ORF Transcript_32891/g.72639 Transcript_32891/m.72639 type:complete len:123 (-) Transcript_32891:111-479(-)